MESEEWNLISSEAKILVSKMLSRSIIMSFNLNIDV